MQNLAGVDPDISTPIVTNELTTAGVTVLTTEFKKRGAPEVKAPVVGVLTFEDGTIVAFSRLWYCWSVRMTKRLPASVATPFNSRWGGTVRVEGYSRGKDVERGGCDSYHVDTQNGLNALVELLRNNFGVLTEQNPTVERLAQLHLVNDAFFG